jgi:hypothetical protein
MFMKVVFNLFIYFLLLLLKIAIINCYLLSHVADFSYKIKGNKNLFLFSLEGKWSGVF